MKILYDDMFTLVFIYMQVTQEFDHITGLVNSMDTFVTDWQSTWIKEITVIKEKGLLTFTNDTADDGMLIYLCGMILQ